MSPLKRDRRVLAWVLVMSSLCIVNSCTTAQLRDIPGYYSLKAEWGVSSLLLLSDNTMEQEVRTDHTDVRRIAGNWHFKEGILTLKPCLYVRLHREIVVADGCASGVSVTAFGKVEIEVDSDYNLSYQKVSNSRLDSSKSAK